MPIKVESVHMNEVIVLAPEVHGDARGFFMEAFRADHFKALGLPDSFVQENHSCSAKGVLRGLHFQWDPPMGKIMRVTSGRAFLVAVDIRKGSPTLGEWFGMEVSAENKKQIWAPYGFARGFYAMTEGCEVQYKCTALYNPQGEGVVLHSDPQIGIRWPGDASQATLSERDRKAPTLAEWLASPQSDRIRFEPPGSVSKGK